MFDMQRHALRLAVIIAVGPALAPSLRWTASSIPTVANVEDALGAVVRRKCADWKAILRDPSASSALQDAHGNWEVTFLSLAGEVGPSIEAMSLAFETHIWPLGSVKATRTKAWRNWRTVLTWAVARNALHRILPMDRTVLQALIWECTAAGGTRDVIRSLLNGIISRHRDAGLPSPLAGPMEYTRFTKCISRLLGTQLAHKYPVTSRADTLRIARRVASCASRILTASTTPGGPLTCEPFGVPRRRCLALSKGWAPESLGRNRWKRARKGLLHAWSHAGNPELTGCFGTI